MCPIDRCALLSRGCAYDFIQVPHPAICVALWTDGPVQSWKSTVSRAVVQTMVQGGDFSPRADAVCCVMMPVRLCNSLTSWEDLLDGQGHFTFSHLSEIPGQGSNKQQVIWDLVAAEHQNISAGGHSPPPQNSIGTMDCSRSMRL